MDPALRNRVAIVGVGYTPMVRRSEHSISRIAADAAIAAIRDAGLRGEDIDGYAGTPVAQAGGAEHWDGVDEVSGRNVTRTLGLRNVRWLVDVARGVVADSVIDAVNALHAGLCSYVLIVRAMYNPVGQRYAERSKRVAGGPEQFIAPYGQQGIGQMALWLRRYMHDYGATKAELYHVAKTLRDHAQLNPHAYWRGKPLTEEDYLGARPIYEPMCVYDCDIPITGAGALVLTTADRAAHLPHKPAYISAYATTYEPRQTVFDRSGVSRAEVGAAQLYDGFLPFIWHWLESLGFCGKGEAHTFALNGNIARGGTLPVTTFGGSQGEGRLHGMGHLREAAMQVMGRAGERQIPGLRNCIVTVGVDWVPGAIFMVSAG
jgi:acetyl-CoA acetyltransferase